MTLRLAVRLGAAAFALLGVVVGVVGTLLMTRMYHPYRPEDAGHLDSG